MTFQEYLNENTTYDIVRLTDYLQEIEKEYGPIISNFIWWLDGYRQHNHMIEHNALLTDHRCLLCDIAEWDDEPYYDENE